MAGLGILILVGVVLYIVWPYIARWLKRKAMEKAEDYMRAQMGLPPRDKKRRRKEREQYRETYDSSGGRGTGERRRRNPFDNPYRSQGPIIPKEYAEDVEFVETIDYSHTEVKTSRQDDSRKYHESQISDVEWTEIKTKDQKNNRS